MMSVAGHHRLPMLRSSKQIARYNPTSELRKRIEGSRLQNTVELGYNVMKGTEYFVSL
jgi:hypothetical protein